MKNNIFVFISLLVLSACTTPETVLVNPQTKQVVRCGGNVAYAGILYPFMLAADSHCVDDYNHEGFKTKHKEGE